MKIGRRSFLSFIIGGAVGTNLSPLPWKLTDDSSIWSQNWPWTPVPADGEVTYVNSTCSLCPGGCGISVRKVEERAVKIEGMKDHPINDGGICLLGASGLQLLYGPTRVTSPMKRIGKRGGGHWEAISWEEALNEVGGKLGELRSSGQPQGLAVVADSNRGTVSGLTQRFMTVYGAPNYISVPSMQDSYELAQYRMNGVQGLVGLDIENADFVLSFGSGVLDGWGSPVRMFRANSAMRDKNAEIFQVESRLSNTAAKSDKWISINPGTETALALGIAHVIIREKRYQNDFVSNYASGFEAFKSWVLADFSPDKVAGITGLDSKTIIMLARRFSRAGKPLAICGKGRGSIPGSMGDFIAVQALNALVGNINREGGVWTVPEPGYAEWPDPEMDSVAAEGLQSARIDGAGGNTFPDTPSNLSRFFETVAAGEGYPVEILFVQGANPLFAVQGTATVRAAFEKIPFIVSFSSYMDETAEQADLLLPNHMYLERLEDIPAPANLQRPYVGLIRPVVEPQFNTRHTGDVMIALAQVMGGGVGDAFPWEDYEACLEDTFGDEWDALQEQGYFLDDSFMPPAWEEAFETASGKFEFPAEINAAGIDGEAGAFPLLLVPYDTIRLTSSYVGNTPFMTKTVPDTVLSGTDGLVEMNPKTAQALGLKEGSAAQLTTPVGTARVRVHLFEGIMPGLLAMPRGLGHSAYDDYLAGKGININDLIGPVADPISGLDAAWGIRAKLAKA